MPPWRMRSNLNVFNTNLEVLCDEAGNDLLRDFKAD